MRAKPAGRSTSGTRRVSSSSRSSRSSGISARTAGRDQLHQRADLERVAGVAEVAPFGEPERALGAEDEARAVALVERVGLVVGEAERDQGRGGEERRRRAARPSSARRIISKPGAAAVKSRRQRPRSSSQSPPSPAGLRRSSSPSAAAAAGVLGDQALGRGERGPGLDRVVEVVAVEGADPEPERGLDLGDRPADAVEQAPVQTLERAGVARGAGRCARSRPAPRRGWARGRGPARGGRPRARRRCRAPRRSGRRTRGRRPWSGLISIAWLRWGRARSAARASPPPASQWAQPSAAW